MRVSDIQRRRSLSAEQPVPLRRSIAWVSIFALIAAGVYLYFRHARALAPLLAS